MGAVEGMVFEARTGALYWTCNSRAAIRAADVRALRRAPAARRRALARTVLRLPAGDHPRGIDLDPCER